MGLTSGRLPLVEVVVPCYNYGRFLEGCVESIVRQPGVQTAVTIVDDRSTDDSADIAEGIVERYPRVKLIRNETNLGAVRTFNRGLSQADSDYVVLLSADDLLAPGALVRSSALMAAWPAVGLVYGHARKFSTEPSPHRGLPLTWSTWRGEEWIDLQLRRAWNIISSPEAMVRTSVQHAAGYYDPGLRHTHDVEMWLRIAALADVGHINGPDQAYYRRQPGSHSAQFSSYNDIEERWQAYRQFLAAWSQVEAANRLRSVVRKRLAAEALGDLLNDLDSEVVDDQLIEDVLALVRRIDPAAPSGEQWAEVCAHRAGYPTRRGQRMARDIGRAVGWQRVHHYRPLG